MDKKMLARKLNDMGLFQFVYFLDNDKKYFHCFDEPRDGVWGPHMYGIYHTLDGRVAWYINDNERGRSLSEKIFETEEQACDSLWNEVCECVDIYKQRTIKVIQQYIASQTNLTAEYIAQTRRVFEKHFDIAEEFANTIKQGFPCNGISVHGYTAQQLNANTHLSVLGAYNYLIYLRENPQEASAVLKAGLPRK